MTLSAKQRDALDRIEAESLQRSIDNLMVQTNQLRERGLTVSLRITNEGHDKRAVLSARRDFKNVSKLVYVTKGQTK